MHADETGTNVLTERIIGCAFRVLNTLGAGFLEKVYENALAHELRETGLAVAPQHGVAVRYDGIVVGEYVVDPLVEGLKATGMPLCLLLNFGKSRLEIHRFAHGL